MKLVVNMVMGTMMTTLAEGLTLAQKADLSQAQLIEVLGLGFMNCPLFALKVQSPSAHCVLEPLSCCMALAGMACLSSPAAHQPRLQCLKYILAKHFCTANALPSFTSSTAVWGGIRILLGKLVHRHSYTVSRTFMMHDLPGRHCMFAGMHFSSLAAHLPACSFFMQKLSYQCVCTVRLSCCIALRLYSQLPVNAGIAEQLEPLPCYRGNTVFCFG